MNVAITQLDDLEGVSMSEASAGVHSGPDVEAAAVVFARPEQDQLQGLATPKRELPILEALHTVFLCLPVHQTIGTTSRSGLEASSSRCTFAVTSGRHNRLPGRANVVRLLQQRRLAGSRSSNAVHRPQQHWCKYVMYITTSVARAGPKTGSSRVFRVGTVRRQPSGQVYPDGDEFYYMKVDTMFLPAWADRSTYRVLVSVLSQAGRSLVCLAGVGPPAVEAPLWLPRQRRLSPAFTFLLDYVTGQLLPVPFI